MIYYSLLITIIIIFSLTKYILIHRIIRWIQIKMCLFFIKSYLPFHSALTNFCGTHAILYHGRNMKSLDIPYI